MTINEMISELEVLKANGHGDEKVTIAGCGDFYGDETIEDIGLSFDNKVYVWFE